MDKEKEIKEISEIVNYNIYQYSSNPYPPNKDMSDCIANDLVLHGYGNKKQAVKEFIDKIADKVASEDIIRHNEKLVTGYTINTTISVHEIKTLFKEFYGEVQNDEEQEIKEMAQVIEAARILARCYLGSMNEGLGMWLSKKLYEAGYRKMDLQSNPKSLIDE